MTELNDLIKEQYKKVLGGNCISRSVDNGRYSVEVLHWRSDSNEFEVDILATVGAWKYAREGDHVCEYYLGLESVDDDVFQTLLVTAVEGNGTHRPPAIGDSISFIEGLWNDSDLCGYLFTNAGPRVFEDELLDGKLVHFVKLYPITEQELAIKKANGYEHLLAWMEAHDINIIDPRRRSER